MNVRPKPTDTEDDVLEMQKKFFAERRKNEKFTPSAQVVRVDNEKKQSLFAQIRTREGKSSTSAKVSSLGNFIVGDIVERVVPDKLPVQPMDTEVDPSPVAFPKLEKINLNVASNGKSLFALSMDRKRQRDTNPSQEDELPSVISLKDNYGETSTLIQEQSMARAIHEENVNFIAQMKQNEIMAERENLLKSLDPNLLRFIEEKRKKKQGQVCDTVQEPKPKFNSPSSKSKTNCPSKTVSSMLSDMQSVDNMEIDQQLITEKIEVDTVRDILHDGESENWLHFNIIEKDKFEWMKNVPSQIAKLKPGETFEARFDWKGVLLPYTEQENQKDERELYLHGDEPHRPGYTLQELFRLCRSNIIQQRVSAFTAIAGILNIYNQGFYDNVLDLPITKIFFLLRFGFDENSPATLEVVSRSLAMLFYNESDEALLDLIIESPKGYLQPTLNHEQKSSENIENMLSKMKLTSKPFTTEIDENDEESRMSMNDFHLAETDLIECLLRTNIVQRIYYILGVVRSENSTVHSCLKILIRIARTGKDACNQIAKNVELMKVLFENFLPSFESLNYEKNEFYDYPQHLMLKLFRIMISQHISLCASLSSYGLQERIKNYLYTRQDIKSKLIKVQIESLRILRAMMLMNMDGVIYRDLLPAFRYMIEWHYKHIDFEEGEPFLIRQHASALLNAIHCGKAVDAVPVLSEMLSMCSCKWFYAATKHGVNEFSQATLLGSTLNCVSKFILTDKGHYVDFIGKYFRQFIQSNSFVVFVSNLRQQSILLKTSNDRRHLNQSLVNAGTVLFTDGSPQLIISKKYPVYLLNSILNFIEILHSQRDDSLITDLINNIQIIEYFTDYVERISQYININLASSFAAKSEIRLLFKILCFKPIYEVMNKHVVLQAAYNLVCCMTSEHILEIETLFRNILFNGDSLDYNVKLMSQWKDVFLGTFVHPHRIFIPATEISLSMPISQSTILPVDWPYMMMKNILNQYLQQISETIRPDYTELGESEIITLSLQFAGLLENNGLTVTSPTEKLMYLMIAFMGPNSEFLDPITNTFLKQTVKNFFNCSKDIEFQFDAAFKDKCKFENLYVLFLDHFQAASYGDSTFSALVLVPLSQKYDSKWRKIVWSEHASVLRFLNCDESDLLGSIDEYLQPIETEESLVKSYAQALSTNLLRPNTIPYKIAQHHVKHFSREIKS